MIKIGVTGGIGSGKSTVSHMLAGYGAEIIDADIISRQVVKKGEKGFVELVEEFGAVILDENGELDRKKLSSIVFENPDKLKVLNSITHKYIVEKIDEKIKSIEAAEKASILVIDAPIPVDRGFLDVSDVVWVVSAEPDVRIKRIMARSGYTYSEAVERLKSQMPDEEYGKVAGIGGTVIDNSGSTEDLRIKVDCLLNKILKGDDFVFPHT